MCYARSPTESATLFMVIFGNSDLAELSKEAQSSQLNHAVKVLLILQQVLRTTPFESDIRWPRQNTFVISLVSDHNLLVKGRFIKKKVPNIRPFEKY